MDAAYLYEKKVYEYIEQNALVGKGDKVLVGLSGGADSVALLIIMNRLGKQLGITVSAVHVEHGIRGEESRHDMRFAGQLCERMGVSLSVYEEDVPSAAKEMKLGEEEAARIIRYRRFDEEAQKSGADAIAVAHHANDQTETVIFSMLRGSDIDGLSGMKPKSSRDGLKIIRPLLCLKRSEIEDYLDNINESYRTDSTNLLTDYARNKIRCEIIPKLEQINDRAADHINRVADKLRHISEYIDSQAKLISKEIVTSGEDGLIIDCKSLADLNEVIADKIVYDAISAVAGRRKDISDLNVSSVRHLAALGVGARADLPYNIEALRDYESILLRKNEKNPDEGKEINEDREIALETGGEYVLADGRNISVSYKEFDGATEKIPTGGCIKWFDCDKIKNSVCLRSPKKDDYLVINPDGTKKKLKRIFIDAKVSADKRTGFPVICDGDLVLWAVGLRTSEHAHVTGQTKRILEIRINE